jgi:muramoyltetrapeptide carboxypeptidase
MPASTSPTVFLWCPAYDLPIERLSATLAAAEGFSANIGGKLVFAADLSVFSGSGAWRSAAERQATFRQALTHDVLLAARGGYGCLDLLAVIDDFTGPLPLLIGYSDLTVLHAAWSVRGEGESIYGFMPGVPHGSRAIASCENLWRGEGITINPQMCPEVVIGRRGQAHGRLFAACLRVLTGLVGTPWMPSLRGAILAIEDIDERPYRIDRDLQQLFLAGCLDGVVGLVTNAFPGSLPNGYQGPSAAQIITTWAGRLEIPAIIGLPFGHHVDPLALPCGRPTTLTVAIDDWQLVLHPRAAR